MKSLRSTTFGPTQKDIGLALNLAQSTVAVALNPKLRGRLPKETVAIIEQKAAEMGYRPQRMARILRNGRSHTLGALFFSGSYHAPQERVKLLAHSALKKGYQLVALDLDWFGLDHRAAEDYLLGAAVEGVVLCNLRHDSKTHSTLTWEKFLTSRGLPFVGMTSFMQMETPSIYADLRDGFYRLTQHHLEQGSRRLKLLLPFRDKNTPNIGKGIDLRIEGFTRAILEAGGEVITDPYNADLVPLPTKLRRKTPGIVGHVHYPIWPEGVKDAFELGGWTVEEFLHKGGTLPDSLVCSNDDVAAGALSVCLKNKIDVPQQILVSGADNAPFSRFCGVPLTTLEQPSEALAEWCLHQIVALIENPQQRSAIATESLPCQLIPRLSTLRKQ